MAQGGSYSAEISIQLGEGNHCGVVRDEPVGPFDTFEELWAAIVAATATPKSRRRSPRAAAPMTGRNAGYVVYDSLQTVIGCVVGGADLAGGRFAAWTKRGKIDAYATAIEAEAAVRAGAAADKREKARAVRERKKRKQKETENV